MSGHEDVISDNTCRCTYFSLDEYADAAKRRGSFTVGGWSSAWGESDRWRGGVTPAEGLELAYTGMSDELDEVLDVAESAVDLCEREHEVETFQPVWDVTGSEVDIARYLTGEPENMIEYPTMKVSKVGRVITLCASFAYSASIDANSIKRRGQVITALALALDRLGHATQILADGSRRL